MPYTVSSAMSQGVPQVGGDEEIAYRNRGLQMQQYLANAQINAMRAMNQDNLTGAQEGRLTDRETALMTGGSYADRAASRAAELSGGYTHDTDMANLNNSANANLANIAGGYQLAGQKVAVGPAQTLADLQGREYGDKWNAGASERDLNDRLNRMITDRISGGGGAPQGQPGEYGPGLVSQSDYQIGNGGGGAGGISPKLLEQIIRRRQGIPDAPPDPLDAAVAKAVGDNIALSDDPGAALATYRSTGKAPNPNATGFDAKTADTVRQLTSQPLIATGLSELSDYASQYSNLMTADKREHLRQIVARLQATASNMLRGDGKSLAMFGDTIKAVLAKAANDRGGGILGALRKIAPAFGQDEARQEFGY